MNSTIVVELLTADSNLLIYSFDPADIGKHRVSKQIITRMMQAQSPLPMQCLVEFYSVTTRKKFLTSHEAAGVVNDFIETLRIVHAELEDFGQAMSIQRQHNVQTFDAMLLATSVRMGCTVFLSEDLQHNRMLDGLLILNPFKLSPAELDTLLV